MDTPSSDLLSIQSLVKRSPLRKNVTIFNTLALSLETHSRVTRITSVPKLEVIPITDCSEHKRDDSRLSSPENAGCIRHLSAPGGREFKIMIAIIQKFAMLEWQILLTAAEASTYSLLYMLSHVHHRHHHHAHRVAAEMYT